MENRCGKNVVSSQKLTNILAIILPLLLTGVAIYMFGESTNNKGDLGAVMISICAIVMMAFSIDHFVTCYKEKKKG